MAADDLAMQEGKASAAMLLTHLCRNSPVSVPGGHLIIKMSSYKYIDLHDNDLDPDSYKDAILPV